MGEKIRAQESCAGCGGAQALSAGGVALTLLVCESCGRCHVEQRHGLSWSRTDFEIAATYYRSLTGTRQRPSPADLATA